MPIEIKKDSPYFRWLSFDSPLFDKNWKPKYPRRVKNKVEEVVVDKKKQT